MISKKFQNVIKTKQKFLSKNNIPINFEYLNYLSLFYYPNKQQFGLSDLNINQIRSGDAGETHEFETDDDFDGDY